jgi:ribonuclease J
MPIHGEWRHLRANADLAIKTGIPEARVILAGDGIVVDLVAGRASIVGAISCGYVYVEGSTVGEVSESLLKDRRVLGEDGFLSIVAAVNFADRKVIAGPQIHARGFSKEESVFAEILPAIRKTLETALNEGVTDTHQLGQMVRRVTGKWVGEKHRRRPMIVPLIISE